MFIPFFTMTVITSLLLYYFGLDPRTGKISISGDAINENELSNNNEPVDNNKTTSDRQLFSVSTTTENDASTEYNNLKNIVIDGSSPYEGIECPVTTSEGFSQLTFKN